MIRTLKIALWSIFHADEHCIKIMEIDSSSTLEDFHFAIQDAVDFDNDHIYEFFIARTETSRDKRRFDHNNGDIYDLTLESIYPLEKGRKLFYLFDYGDHWLFRISKTQKRPAEPVEGVEYPRVVESEGKNPEQYPGSVDWEICSETE